MRGLLSILLVAAWCPAAGGEPPRDRSADAPTTAPAGSDTDTFEDFDPLDIRPAGVIEPRGGAPVRPRAPKLPPEGTMVIDRLCRIETDPSGWVLLTFPNEKGKKPIRPRWALPNELLEKMEKLETDNVRTGRRGSQMLFRLSGETTVHRRNLFLLIRRVAIVEGPNDRAGENAATRSSSGPPKVARGEAAAQPKAATRPREKGPSSADLMRALLNEKNPDPVIVTPRKAELDASGTKSVAPRAKRPTITPATRNIIVDRLVTIQPAGVGKWCDATFEADNTLREPPARLLPCRMLNWVAKVRRSDRLQITGEITTYKGRRFLLLRKAIVERPLGQL